MHDQTIGELLGIKISLCFDIDTHCTVRLINLMRIIMRFSIVQSWTPRGWTLFGSRRRRRRSPGQLLDLYSCTSKLTKTEEWEVGGGGIDLALVSMKQRYKLRWREHTHNKTDDEEQQQSTRAI